MRVNDDITATRVRLIDENDHQVGVVSLEEAKERARDADLDLVEIATTATPVVCKIIDYGKYKYKESRKRHEARMKQKKVEVKEIKFRLIISPSDYQVKLRNAIRFLSSGNRVRASLSFRGREVSKQDIGQKRLLGFIEDLSDYADVESYPNLEGRRLTMLMVPKKNKKDKGEKNA